MWYPEDSHKSWLCSSYRFLWLRFSSSTKIWCTFLRITHPSASYSVQLACVQSINKKLRSSLKFPFFYSSGLIASKKSFTVSTNRQGPTTSCRGGLQTKCDLSVSKYLRSTIWCCVSTVSAVYSYICIGVYGMYCHGLMAIT